MEEQQEVKMVKVDFKCPECETGYLRPTGQVLTVSPPIFPHRCDNPDCQYSERFRVKYPYTTTEPIKPQMTDDEILQIIADSINYNNLCAIKTLGELPKVTLEDLKKYWVDEN